MFWLYAWLSLPVFLQAESTLKGVYHYGVAMQKGLESTRAYTETGRGTLPAANIAYEETDIDPMILARLDLGLLK